MCLVCACGFAASLCLAVSFFGASTNRSILSASRRRNLSCVICIRWVSCLAWVYHPLHGRTHKRDFQTIAERLILGSYRLVMKTVVKRPPARCQDLKRTSYRSWPALEGGGDPYASLVARQTGKQVLVAGWERAPCQGCKSQRTCPWNVGSKLGRDFNVCAVSRSRKLSR